MGWADLLTDGFAANLDLIADVSAVRTDEGERIICVRLAGGLTFDVLIDHGLDIGPVWCAGIPVAWRSALPGDPGPGADWEARFRGGLLATCGPDNIGEPRAGSGQHGTHHHTPATEVSIHRDVHDGEASVRICGTIAHVTLGGRRIVIEREITARTGSCAVRLRDTVRNIGTEPIGVPLLYHVNLGAPLLVPGSTVVSGATHTTTREPLPSGRDATSVPGIASDHVPVVAEHRSAAWDDAESGWAEARVEDHGQIRAVVRWTAASLPRLNTWIFPASGTWVLGVEPSSAPLFGSERDTSTAGAPVLSAGASWECGVEISFPGISASTDLEPSSRR